MSNSPRMGRGLEALWGAEKQAQEQVESTPPSSLDINTIIPNPNQPRKRFSDESLEELAVSIKQQGIIQPLLVRPNKDCTSYQLIAGERRFRAAKLAGLTEVPVYIRDLDDLAAMAAALIENIQREDLSPIEEARALSSLRDEYGITQEELALRVGKSRSAITNSLRLLQLSTQAQEDVQNGLITAGHARALLSLAPNENAQEILRQEILQKKLSVRDTEAAATCYKENNYFPWDNDLEVNAVNVESVDVPAVASTKSNRTKPAYLQQIQKQFKNTYQFKSTISGSEDRGRITLTYANQDELKQILELMKVNV